MTRFDWKTGIDFVFRQPRVLWGERVLPWTRFDVLKFANAIGPLWGRLFHRHRAPIQIAYSVRGFFAKNLVCKRRWIHRVRPISCLGVFISFPKINDFFQTTTLWSHNTYRKEFNRHPRYGLEENVPGLLSASVIEWRKPDLVKHLAFSLYLCYGSSSAFESVTKTHSRFSTFCRFFSSFITPRCLISYISLYFSAAI